MSDKAMAGEKKSEQSTVRVFIAFTLPDHVIESLSEFQEELRRYNLKIKWSRPENIHVTLKFLGDIPEIDVIPISCAIETAVSGMGPIQLSAKGVGVFPRIRRPAVLWTGIAGQMEQLEKLHRAVDEGLEALGYGKDDRRFTGHLTLGRFKGPQNTDALIDIMQSYADRESCAFVADAVHVYQSDLKPSGPVYTLRGCIRLTGPVE